MHCLKEQDDIDKIYLHAKDLSESKDAFFIKRCEDARIKHLNDWKAFIGHSNTINDVYEDINGYNLARKGTVLIAFDDMIADVTSNNLSDAGNRIFHLHLSPSLVFLFQKKSN